MKNNIKALIQEGIAYVEKGRLGDAVNLFNKVTKLNPKQADAYHLLGVIASRKGDLLEATRLIKKAIKYAPKVPSYHRNLGLTLLSRNKNAEAIKSLKKSILISGGDSESHNDLGTALSKVGKVDEAIREYRKALSKNPENQRAHYNLANGLLVASCIEESIDCYKRSIDINPHHIESYIGLSRALMQAERVTEAVEYCEAVVKIDPRNPESHFALGNVQRESRSLENAISSYDKAISINQSCDKCYNNRGTALSDLKRYQEAEESYTRAIEINSGYAEAYRNLGKAQKELNKLPEAEESYKKAVRISPDDAETYTNLGKTQKNQGKLQEAEESYSRALQIDPDYAEAHLYLSLLSLLKGDMTHGWRGYEYRKSIQQNAQRLTSAPYKAWSGESLEGKRLLVVAEQGVGDEVMFSSCIPDLIGQNADEILLECDARLIPLFSRSFHGVEFLERKNRAQSDWLSDLEGKEIDFQVAMGSLPKFFRKDSSVFPKRASFLSPDHPLLLKWKKRYAEIGEGLKVGISWRGGTGRSQGIRSIDLAMWESVLGAAAHFVNLQYGDHADEVDRIEDKLQVHLHRWEDTDPLMNLDDFAAQIAALDLVISIDNSTVHFAGALGVPVWVLLPYMPDSRWMLDRSDSPWYPSMRLFRQKVSGEWEVVMQGVEARLDNHLAD